MSQNQEDREQNPQSEQPEASETSPKGGGGIKSAQTTSRLILLIAIVIAVCVLIIRNFDVSKNIVMVLLGFGAVILIHELGHFIVAKLCGIKVEAFSIGMPPTLIGIKKADLGWRIRILPELIKGNDENSDEGLLSFKVGRKILPGETEYRVGLIPLGGFVKMLGQEDVGPVKTSMDPRSFSNKPVLARAAVLAAGVTFNVISAAIGYMVVFLVGIGLTAPIVGGIIPGSPAEKAGIKPGDEIVQVAGNSSRLDFSDIVMAAVLSDTNEAVPLKIKHADGTIENVSLKAAQIPGAKFRGFGLEKPSTLHIGQLTQNDSNQLFMTTGLRPKDVVKAVGGVDVNYNWQIDPIIEGTFEPNISIKAQRQNKSGQTDIVEGHLPLGFMPVKDLSGESEVNLANICGLVPRLKIAAVSEGSRSLKNLLMRLLGISKSKEKLEAGDIIVRMADVNNPTFMEMREITRAHENNELPITVLRAKDKGPEKQLTITVTPRRDADSNRVLIGIMPELDTGHAVVARTITTRRQSIAAAIPRGATITAVDGTEVKNFYDIARQLKRNSGQQVSIDWRIDEQKAGNTVVSVGEKWDVVMAYTVPQQALPFADMERMYKADGPLDAIKMGYKRTKTFIIQTYVTLYQLIGGLVSPKQLMGPVGILTFSYQIVSAHPFIYYVYFLGLISASIAVLNFMPVPPFDGGLTVLLLIEKIKGSPLSVKVQETIAYAAWALLISLMLYITYNDILRLIFGF
jgi:regulator of sigma E protease